MAKRERRRRKKRNPFLSFLKVLLLVVLVGILAVLGVFYFGGYYGRIKAMKDEADSFVSESTKDTFVPSQTGMIYDAEGDLISETLPEKDSNYLTYSQIPDLFKQAVVSIEDKNFYKHGGVDYKAKQADHPGRQYDHHAACKGNIPEQRQDLGEKDRRDLHCLGSREEVFQGPDP